MNRTLRRLAVVPATLALTAGSLAMTTGAAHAGVSFDRPQVHVKSVQLVAGEDAAVVTAKYRCVGTAVHLWASVKQGGTLPKDNPSSAAATAWRETPEPAESLPTCDGAWHTEHFTIGVTPDTAAAQKAALSKGLGWLQFVFFTVDFAT